MAEDPNNNTLVDPLASGRPLDRLSYATGELLGADDMFDEQTFHRGRLARALANLHGSGTAAGLLVQPDDTATQIVVNPGLAVDPIGRLIEVPARMCIRIVPWLAQQGASASTGFRTANSTVVADVFVRFVPCERGRTPAFAAGDFQSTDATAAARVRDCFEIKMFIRTETALPIPTPLDFPDPTVAAATRPQILRDKIMGVAKADGTVQGGAWETEEALRTRLDNDPMRPRVDGADRFAVFLARVTIPATRAGTVVSVDPARKPTVDNNLRPLAVTSAALARWLGIF